jgi:hypothetical protein
MQVIWWPFSHCFIVYHMSLETAITISLRAVTFRIELKFRDKKRQEFSISCGDKMFLTCEKSWVNEKSF